jgi:hypothetical protein
MSTKTDQALADLKAIAAEHRLRAAALATTIAWLQATSRPATTLCEQHDAAIRIADRLERAVRHLENRIELILSPEITTADLAPLLAAGKRLRLTSEKKTACE